MGKLRFDKILVLDLEINDCADCGLKEIIEIGVCLLDIKGNIFQVESLLVRPTGKISPHITKLTGWTWNDLKKAPPLNGVWNRLVKEYGAKTRMWAGWGDDRTFLLQELDNWGDIDTNIRTAYIDVSALYMFRNSKDKNISLEDAIGEQYPVFIGSPHVGKWDAFNTAKLLRRFVVPSWDERGY